MRASRHLLALATAAMALPAQAPAPATAAAFAVHCGRLLTGDATLTDAWLVVRDGKVVSVGTDAPPADLPVVDAEGKVVMPGIVAADSDLSGAADAEYNVTPDFVAADGFDFDRNYRDALMGGVTTAYLSPGRERLISGQGSVVKLAGTDVVQRVLKDAACLRINVGDGAVLAPRVFEPTPHPTADDPLLPARIQKPTARIGVLAELRALFGRGTDQDQHLAGQGSGENKYDKSALAAVVQGRLPLRAAATKAQDVRRALELAHELGCRLVLENPQEIGALAAQAGAQKAMATFRLPALPGMPNPGGEDRRQKRPEPTFTAAAKAAAAGMTIAVGPPVGMPLRDFMLAAALAVRGGLGREQALRAITIDAARVLGVDDHVGSLAAGKDGDFVILSGEPLAVGTMVETTYIDGKIAFQRKTGAGQLAVRCGRIHDAEGHVFRNGVILVADGKVRGVGEDLAIPYGARVIDVPSGVMTPGLIDAFSHLGLAGDGTPVPPGAANQRLADAIDPADPMFAPALAAGLTTVLVSGKDSGLQSGRVTAVKTGSKDAATAVVRAIAGQRLVFDAIGPDATKPLKELLDRGKQYSKTWHDYDKALADYKAGKTAPKPAAAAKPAEAPPPAKDDPIGGTWEGEITQGRGQLKVVLELKLDGTKVTGKVHFTIGTNELPAQDLQGGSFEAGKLKLEFRFGNGNTAITLEADVTGDEMKGKWTGQRGEQEFNAKRTGKEGSKPAAAAAAPATTAAEAPKAEAPKAPAIDDNLEPLRAVVDKQAALVVRCNRGPALKELLALLQQDQLPYLLHGAEGVLDDPTILGSARPGVLLEPEMVRDQDGTLTNIAARMAELSLPIAFGTGDCAGARHLLLHAIYAVRYGLSSDDALLAITRHPAQLFQLDDRIGSLRRGKDADFVVFSGDPFEPTSRVLLVVCDGEVVVDQREEAGK